MRPHCPLVIASLYSIDDVSKPLRDTKSGEDAQPTLNHPAVMSAHRTHRPRWEKRMRPRLILNSLEEGPRCIMIPIHLKTTDMLEEVNSEAMVDSGATTGDF